MTYSFTPRNVQILLTSRVHRPSRRYPDNAFKVTSKGSRTKLLSDLSKITRNGRRRVGIPLMFHVGFNGGMYRLPPTARSPFAPWRASERGSPPCHLSRFAFAATRRACWPRVRCVRSLAQEVSRRSCRNVRPFPIPCKRLWTKQRILGE